MTFQVEVKNGRVEGNVMRPSEWNPSQSPHIRSALPHPTMRKTRGHSSRGKPKPAAFTTRWLPYSYIFSIFSNLLLTVASSSSSETERVWHGMNGNVFVEMDPIFIWLNAPENQVLDLFGYHIFSVILFTRRESWFFIIFGA